MRKAAILAVLILMGCAGDSEPTVDWSAYSSSIQPALTEEAANKDCASLTSAYDLYASEPATQLTMSRAGHGNYALLKWIRWKQGKAGCPQSPEPSMSQ